MKSKIVEAKEVVPEIVYPCLMIARDEKEIILFLGKGRGIVLSASKGSGSKVGDDDNTWTMDCFTPFHGTIELSN